MKKKIKAWAVGYKSSLGLEKICWRTVSELDGKPINYPRIFMSEEEAKKYGKDRSDYKFLKIIPVEIHYSIKRKV